MKEDRRPFIRTEFRIVSVVCCLVGLGLAGLVSWNAPIQAASSPKTPRLQDFDSTWQRDTAHLMTEPEREAFAELRDPLDKEHFIHRFWSSRQALPGQEQAALLERWQRNRDDAKNRFPDRFNDRARAVLIAGKPSRVVALPSCSAGVRPLEVWWFRHREEEFPVLFVAEDPVDRESLRWWSPEEELEALHFGQAPRQNLTLDSWLAFVSEAGCWSRFPRVEGWLQKALSEARGPSEMVALLYPKPPDPVPWLNDLAAELASQARPPVLTSTRLQVELLGRYHQQRKIILRGRLSLPTSALERNGQGQLFDRLIILGDIWRGDRLIDAFRIVHHVAGQAPGAEVELDFYRRLKPGLYDLDLRLADAHDLALLRGRFELDIQPLEHSAEAPAGRRLGYATLTREDVGMLTTFPSVELLVPEEGTLAGEVEIEAATSGGPIDRVDLYLDGEHVGSDADAPYAWTVDWGPSPVQRQAQALALDASELVLAQHQLELNADVQRFAVRLLEPQTGGELKQARVEVDIPSADQLEKVELFLNDQRIARLTEPPFVHPLEIDRSQLRQMTWIRALAVLESGEAKEDLVMIHSPDAFSRVDVQLVELFVSVSDRRGLPITDLTQGAFRVFEDDASQDLLRFDRVDSLPLNVALVMDVSGSMRGRVRTASASAERFFATVLTEKDRAAFLTFNHDIHLESTFTSDVERLRYSARGARAWGTTRLYDSLIYATHAFGGLPGKRALVLLSDGRDVDSDFAFKQVLETALRARLAVYPIALELPDAETQSQLQQLAEESGGRFFAIQSIHQLTEIYERIEQDLRSQYLLVYRPPENGGRDFRQVRVEVSKPELRVRTTHGYYP